MNKRRKTARPTTVVPITVQVKEEDEAPASSSPVVASDDIIPAKRTSQQETMKDIDRQWDRARRQDRLYDHGAEQIFAGLRSSIDALTCAHDDVVLCGICAGNEGPLPWDAFIMSKDHSDGFIFKDGPFQGRQASERLLRAKAVANKQWLQKSRSNQGAQQESWSECDEVYFITNDFEVIKPACNKDVEDIIQIRHQIAETFSCRLDHANRLTASARLFNVSHLSGMKFTADRLTGQETIVREKTELGLYRPTLWMKADIESFTHSTIISCNQGSVMLAIWPGTLENIVTVLSSSFRERRPGLPDVHRQLLAPRLIHLFAGEMVVLPPFTITAMVVIDPSVVSTWRSIPRHIEQTPDVRKAMLDNIRLVGRLQHCRQATTTFNTCVDDEVEVWQCFCNALRLLEDKDTDGNNASLLTADRRRHNAEEMIRLLEQRKINMSDLTT